MYLALQVTSSQAALMGPSSGTIFGESGGTIGRAASNDWTLPDEEKFISSRHAIIRCMGGMYSLEDVSTNGTFINGQPQPIGAGNDPVILKSGDRIQIGDYDIFVSIVEEEGDAPIAAAPEPQAPPMQPDPLITSPTGQFTSPPTSPTSPTVAPQPQAGPVDPLDLLGDAAPPPPPQQPAAFPDHSSAMSDAFIPPGPIGGGGDAGGGMIGDDFLDDVTGFRKSGSTPPQPPPAPSIPPQGAPPQPTDTGVIPPEAAPSAAPGMGAPPPQPAGAGLSGDALFQQLMPLIVQGMMDVLQSRADIKSQFRLALTTIKPVENNPLKFSPNADDAMQHLFGSGQSGYLGPIEAFDEGFNDIKAHQMAMLAGMRAAFEHMLEQFSPDVLEEKFEGGAKRGKLMGMANKVRYWDLYREMFNRITRDSDDNFRRLFGEEFASAYEEQMQRITSRR